jgi:hypothetical protein
MSFLKGSGIKIFGNDAKNIGTELYEGMKE